MASPKQNRSEKKSVRNPNGKMPVELNREEMKKVSGGYGMRQSPKGGYNNGWGR